MDYSSEDEDAFTGTLLNPDDPMDLNDDMIDMNAGVSKKDEEKITVKFTTSLPKDLRVPETPFEVPSSFSRLGWLCESVFSSFSFSLSSNTG